MDHASRDEAPRVTAAGRQAETLARRVNEVLLDTPQNIRKLAARTSPAIVTEGQSGLPSSYDPRTMQLCIVPEADSAEMVHEYLHHIDYRWANAPFQTVSVDRRSRIGLSIHIEIQRFGMLGEAGRKALVPQIRGDLNLEDIFDAISFSELGRGHGRDYGIANTGSRYREIFANLGSMYATGRWGRVKRVLPELAVAFEQWLDEILGQE